MKKRFWRIAVISVLTVLCIPLLGGCVLSNAIEQGLYNAGMGSDTYEDYGYSMTDMRESVTEGYFRLTIYTEKDTYARGEAIDCWAELEYIGDSDSITVYNIYGRPIEMSMIGNNVDYASNSSYYSEDEEMTLKKGVPIRYTLAEAVPKSASALPGQYEIDAYAYLSLTPDDMVSYSGYVSAVIVVEE